MVSTQLYDIAEDRPTFLFRNRLAKHKLVLATALERGWVVLNEGKMARLSDARFNAVYELVQTRPLYEQPIIDTQAR